MRASLIKFDDLKLREVHAVQTDSSLWTCCYRRSDLTSSVAMKCQCNHPAQCAADARCLQLFCTHGFLSIWFLCHYQSVGRSVHRRRC